MKDHAAYLISVSCCMIVFYMLYSLFRNTTFFAINRFILLAGIILSFIIPAFRLEIVAPDIHMMSTEIAGTSLPVVKSRVEEIVIKTEPGLTSNLSFLTVIYWTGFVIMFIKTTKAMGRILRLRWRATILNAAESNVIIADVKHPFSFFRWIFLPKGPIDPIILEHENVHIRQLHWVDLLVLEISGIILWFNPVMIFYKRAVKLQHEYLADAQALAQGTSPESYLTCLLKNIQLDNDIPAVSQFSSQTIKKRVIMITKPKSPSGVSSLYLLSLPIVSLLLLAFSTKPTPDLPINHLIDDGETVIVIDAGHGGSDGGVQAGNIIEKEFTLAMAKDIQRAGKDRGIKVILTRNGDQAISLQERLDIVSATHADLFISLHTNFDEKNFAASGIECFVSEGNKEFSSSRKLADQLIAKFRSLDGIATREIGNFDAYVLRKNLVPSVLVELGFLSSETDRAYLANSENQTLISNRVIEAVLAYGK